MKKATNKTPEPVFGADSIKSARRARYNPLRSLTPETLTRALDAFEYGDLREFALLAEVVADRDDTLKSVKPKREKATAAREWKVLKRDKSPEAEKHQEILKAFWDNVRAENAYDRNERGGMGRLIKQMMTSVSYRYAVHHIVWRPEPGRLRATFEFVPLWFFENREGRLRFIKDGVGVTGEEMDPREWMVTFGDGLMIACLIDYLGKKFCTQDWLAFSEKFSMPGVLGRVSAGKDTPAGKAMKSAVESFGQDFSAVVYGDDGTAKIELIQPNGSPTAMPMPAFIERADRKMAALYRGADLSSMSSKDGEGTGASLQSEETDTLEADDCMTISETLQEVEREVIRWHYGEGVEPLAYIEVQPPVRVDKKFILEAIKTLQALGVRLSVTEVLESLGFSEADADDVALGATQDLKTQDSRQDPVANSAEPGAMNELIASLQADLQPLGKALAGALQADDFPAMQAALRMISERMPEFLDSELLAAAIGDELLAAFTGGVTANAFDPSQSRDIRGRWSEGGGGGSSSGDWKSNGLLPGAKIVPDEGHAPVPSYKAAARLMQGETVLDDRSSPVLFNDELMDHWSDKPRQEIKKRLGELDDAVGAVKNPHEVWQKANQTVYLRKYSGNGPVRWMAVYVPNGKGRTYYSSDRINKADESFRQGKLLRTR